MNTHFSKIALLLTAATVLMATGAIGQTPLQIGSANTATAEPPEARPETTPCVVNLYTNFTPTSSNLRTFSFIPPADCPAPWAKVIMSANFSMPAGRGGDRTVSLWVGATNILYAAAMLPTATNGQTWHTERDVTDYSALFSSAQTGQLTLTNVKSAPITSSASLLFFPASDSSPAPASPDVVLPISADPVLGGQVFTNAGGLTRTFTTPQNVERAFIDIIARNATVDEFFYACVPDAGIANQLQTCSGTPFREVEISIDGQPAGVAPAFPRITGGGIDPKLWLPIPSILDLNFRPYRLDVTPFAGLLNDGHPHQVAIAVANAVSYALNGAVLLFLDHGSSHVTGGLQVNTLGAPAPVSSQNVQTANGVTSGSFTLTSDRDFRIGGFVNTSHGRVDTEIEQHVELENTQLFHISASAFDQSISQKSRVRSVTARRGSDHDGRHGDDRQSVIQETEFPLSLKVTVTFNPDGSLTQAAVVGEQHNQSAGTVGDDGRSKVIRNAVHAQDTLFFSPSFAIVGNTGQATSQSYFTRSSDGDCFSRRIAAANSLLVSIEDGRGCRKDSDDKDGDKE